MRPWLWTLGWCVTAAVVAVACSGDDKQVVKRSDGGAGGEAPQASAGEGGAQPHAGSAGSSGAPSNGGQGGPGGVGSLGGEGGAETTAPGGASAGGAPDPSLGGASSGGEGGMGGAAPTQQTVVELGFDDSNMLPANLDPGTAVLAPTQGYADLGPEGDKFGSTFLRGPTGTVITLTLTDLPPHSSLSLSLLFAAIDSLDGTGAFPAGDFFKITVDGNVVFRESFANATPDQVQSYDPPAAAVLARHVDLGFSGPGSYYTDSAYDFGQDPRFQNLAHTASSAVVVFTLEGEGVQSVDDESWAIDNVRVTANP